MTRQDITALALCAIAAGLFVFSVLEALFT